MKNDIFGNHTYGRTYCRGVPGSKILLIILSGISALMALVILCKFRLVTALIAMGVAEILTTGIPILIVIGIFFYIIFRIKWRTRRYFW